MNPTCDRIGCNNPVTDDDLCHGCGVYVCEEHNTNLEIGPEHGPEDHWRGEDDLNDDAAMRGDD